MWYYFENRQRKGPVSGKDIVALVRQGVITRTTYVCKEGGKPQKAETLLDLAMHFPAQPVNSSTTTSSVAQPTVQPTAQQTTQPVEQQVAQPTAQQTTQPVEQQTTQPVEQQAVEPTGTTTASKAVQQIQKSSKKVTATFQNNIWDSSAMKGFSLRKLFSEALKKHSDEEMECYFGVGTPFSTPPLNQVNPSWPTPWFFCRLVLFGLAGFFLLWLGYDKWNNPNCAPGAIFFGSFAIPIAGVMFFYECNVLKNVSLYQVIKLFLFGGIFGLLLALIGFDFMPFAEQLGASRAGIVEEPAKLLVLILVLKMGGLLNKNYILNGLLFGAAVGAGFAAFESAGYAFTIYGRETLQAGKEMLANEVLHGIATTSCDPQTAMYNNLVMRGMLSPFGHIIWTAMSAAALWRVKGDKEFEFSMLFNPMFLIIFAIAIALHMTWNSNLEILDKLGPYTRYVILGAIGWAVIFGMMGFGLRQVRQEQEKQTVS